MFKIKKNKTLVIIDGNSLLFAQYYGFAKSAIENGGVIGFMYHVLAILKNINPLYMVIVWDGEHSRDLRLKIDPNYKQNRSDTPQELLDQVALCQKCLNDFGMPQFISEGYEGDDVCFSFSKKVKDVPIRILTKDKDSLQCINSQTNIWLIQQKDTVSKLKVKYCIPENYFFPKNTFRYDKNTCFEEFGYFPEEVAHIKALFGDSADNIQGIKGVGEKTALKLISKYHTIHSLYEDIENKGIDEIKSEWSKELKINKKTVETITNGKESAFQSYELAILHEIIDDTFNINYYLCNVNPKNVSNCINFLKK